MNGEPSLALPPAFPRETPCPCVWQRRIGGIKEGLEGGESAFCACMFHLAPPPFFPLPGQFEFEVNRYIFFSCWGLLKGGV